ncbi:phospholipase b-like [Plakobranchus ocellatus]|uniref:Phospholipase B-like n=1 Tax=Plakobranchus ocellatus TaxID=259542 RepID=A0AAV4CIK6_9GAST|nr:phospholipase b-like [Plakobranchus ocellatus]
MALKFFLVVCLLLNGIVSADKLFHSGSVYCEKVSCKFKESVLDKEKATAYGTFNDTLLVTGWGILDIVAGTSLQHGQTNTDIMFAAGFIEGVFTAKQMEYNYANLVPAMGIGNPLLEKLRTWFVEQQNWTNMMIKKHSEDPFWRHVSYVNAQLDGLFAGYKSVQKNSTNALDMFALKFLNGVGDVIDLRYALSPSSFPDWMSLTREQAQHKFYTSGHCSALIKVLPAYENIFMSHSSWFAYSATDRIYKHYFFNVKDEATVAKKMSFSSYAGYLESLDDFYLMESGLVMLQTTNNVFNKKLYNRVKPQSLLAWQRVRVANMMSHTGKDWTTILASFNSGTYNNQYMVIDLKQIKLGTVIADNALWVAEQIPGLVVADDLTPILRAGYFASYNVPFFEEIYNMSGYPDMAKKHGSDFTYQLAPRAKIFRRDQAKVKDLATMKAIMRYNDYKNDPYSEGSPWGAICSRGDLDPTDPVDDGCYDTKVTDYDMAKQFQADAISGPTLGTNLPVFAWPKGPSGSPHKGLPDIYNFPFMRMQPRFGGNK